MLNKNKYDLKKHLFHLDLMAKILLAVFLFWINSGFAMATEEPADVPSPRLSNRWVVDMTNSVESQELDRVNAFCEKFHEVCGGEFAVVIIKSTDQRSIEEFANELFNLWGIGNATENNGILFLVAKDDKRMRIELGDGIDSPREEAIAQEILDEEVRPRFRDGDFADGLYAGTVLTAMDIFELDEEDFDQEFSGFEQPNPHRTVIANFDRNKVGGEKNRWVKPVLFVGSLLGIGGIGFVATRRYLRFRPRYCGNCRIEMVRLEEHQDDDFLDPPEQVEEQIGSVDYDVWACLPCEDVIKFRYGKFFTRFSTCPECGYKTKFQITTTLIHATTSHGGKVHVEERCKNCSYHNEYYYATPRISKSSSSSSFSGGGSSGFGGGSSSGGGASSGW